MKITAIEVTHHRWPLDPPFRAAWDGRPREHVEASIVRIDTDEGLSGFGSGDLMLGLDRCLDLFIGQDPTQLDRHFQVIENIGFHYGRCWPLDLALWDLYGKIRNAPVWKLVGGRSDRIRLYASSGTLRDSGEMAEAAERFRDEGFAALKIRFRRGDLRDDFQALEAVRSRIGDALELMVDCNQGWRMPWDVEAPWTLDQARSVARELERLDVYWMEEPLHRGDRDGMRRLRETTKVRVAGGAMTRELYEIRDLITAGAVDVVQPDAALVGGVTGLRGIAELAEAEGVIFTPHTWTNGIGMIANAHLTAGAGDAPFLEFPYDPPEWSTQRRDIMLAAPIEHTDGELRLSDAPGFGVDIDPAALEASRIA